MAELQLAEILAVLSQVTDLGMGQPPESAVRTCLLATGLARRMDIPEREVADIYYTALLQHIGCTAYAHETAELVDGNDIELGASGAKADDASLQDTLAFMLTGIARDSSPLARIRAVVNVLRAGPSFPQQLYRSNCEVAVRTADRLGLPRGVQRGLDTVYVRPDGKAMPLPKDQEVALPSRFAQVAGQATLFHHLGGPDLAIDSIRRRAGAAFEIDATDPLLAVVDAEPEPKQRIPDTRLEGFARALADITDLKSPWLHGHSAAVAAFAEASARELGLSEIDISRISLAGYLHDLGRVGVPSGIWNKAGPLTTAEWEQVQLHLYHTERILARSPALADLARMAGMHHERFDGSGYHRGASGKEIPIGARILAVADTCDTMVHDRPYHAALSPERAASKLLEDADRGALDAEAVRAILHVIGHATEPTRRSWPAGLTGREVEVLQLAAHGMSNKEIDASLSISPKTADHHIQHIYTKIGVSTRAGAALFAMEHDLINRPVSEK